MAPYSIMFRDFHSGHETEVHTSHMNVQNMLTIYVSISYKLSIMCIVTQ